MSTPLPTLRGSTKQILYGSTRTVSFRTMIRVGANGVEARWPSRVPLHSFIIPMRSLSLTDRNSEWTLLDTAKGRFAKNLTLTVGATTYSNLTLDTDTLASINRQGVTFDMDINLRQVSNYPWTPPVVGTTFPDLSGGHRAQRPYTQGNKYQTLINDSAYGSRITWAWWGGGLTGFPTTKLKTWIIEYPLLTDADLSTLETFFLGCRGRYKSFSFIDPLDAVTYNNVRFDNDDLPIRYITNNQNSTTISLRQTYNS